MILPKPHWPRRVAACLYAGLSVLAFADCAAQPREPATAARAADTTAVPEPPPGGEREAGSVGGTDGSFGDADPRRQPGPRATPSWGPALRDDATLAGLLRDSGVRLPPGFKALVVRVSTRDGGAPPTYAFFDYRGTSLDRDDWWPASSVKLFAAVAALERLRALGFSPAAEVTYRYSSGDVVRTVEWLVREAITPSNNVAFDQLVEIVGGDEFNRWFARRGLGSTVMLRGYSHRVMDPDLHKGVLRDSPAITLAEGKRTRTLPERHGILREGCKDLGNCTTLLDLADVLRRVMLHELLPAAERLDLGPAEIALLRSALSGKRTRGLGVVNGLKAAFDPRTIETYSKPGFAAQWFSDHVFLVCRSCPADRRHWIVAMAGYGGRDVLDEAARKVGDFIVAGKLALPPASR